MNTLISSNETISQFNLKRVLNFWGHTDEKYLYFMLMPPWLKQKISEAYENVILKENLNGSYPKEGKDKKKLKLYSAEIDI